jgi:hypothetical protein
MGLVTDIGMKAQPARLPVAAGYELLADVLDAALAQAQSGKGKERHAGEGEAFHEQQIVQLCEWMGSTQGDVFQAAKKAIESTRLPPERAKAELLGAINYLAAAVIVLDRQEERRRPMPANANEQHHERACLCEVTPCPCRCHGPEGSNV